MDEFKTRYLDQGLLGIGGTSEVRRIFDQRLRRTLAIKRLHPELTANLPLVSRFLEEAQITAQLQHPGVIPIHDQGWDAQGVPYIIMPEVRGRTLNEVLTTAYLDGSPSPEALRRLIGVLVRICEAVAFAHVRGVVHRDLKPSNVMVGEHGEVLVLDWGIARLSERDPPDAVTVSVWGRDAMRTQQGDVTGTPAFMPPEQAEGALDRIGPASDVYALGAILYAILSGHPPYQGPTPESILRKVRHGPPPTLQLPMADFGVAPLLPPRVVEICEQAMARQPQDRYPTAAELGGALQKWLDGAEQREAAAAVVQRAEGARPEAARLRARAETLRASAEALLVTVASWQPEEAKLAGWALEDEAARLEHNARMANFTYERLLQGALTHAADEPDAHRRLALLYQRRHQAAERARDLDALAQNEAMLTAHVAALPAQSQTRLRLERYLAGQATLSLQTRPPARARLHRFVTHNRRQVPQLVADLGQTPTQRTLPHGSYLVRFEAEGFAPVQYPVLLEREGRWNSDPVRLPRQDEIDLRREAYVPAGQFWYSGDETTPDFLPGQWVWLDGFIMQRFPITNAEYLTFLNDLLHQGREDEALQSAPRERASAADRLGALLYARDDAGRFVLAPDREGFLLEENAPVVMIDWRCAYDYARWRAARDGLPWRLPTELEWEKAGRGVDRRLRPWGDTFDPSWCCMRDSHPGEMRQVTIDRFPLDESVYGVRGLGGNVWDWLYDEHSPRGPLMENGRGISPEERPEHFTARTGVSRVARGGDWNGTPRASLMTYRYWVIDTQREPVMGFRLVRPFTNDPGSDRADS